jgi:hypothetical protein
LKGVLKWNTNIKKNVLCDFAKAIAVDVDFFAVTNLLSEANGTL